MFDADADQLAALLEVQERRLDDLMAENTALALGFATLADVLVSSGLVHSERLREEAARAMAAFEADADDERRAFLERTRSALHGLLSGEPLPRRDPASRTH